MRVTQGCFSFLPDLTDEQFGRRFNIASTKVGR